MDIKKEEKEGNETFRLQSKYVHVTIHKVDTIDKKYWVDKGKSFRQNVVAVIVGVESNHEEDKGNHVHIFLQFSTKQDLSRRQFIKHFGSDCIHISPRKTRHEVFQGLGYVSKTGNVLQHGIFSYRGVDIEADPVVYRFTYEVKGVDDAFKYFAKVIQEYVDKDPFIIEKMHARNDAIGRWLQRNPTHYKTLDRLAHTWSLDYRNEQKKGFKYADWCWNEKKNEVKVKELREEYVKYLNVYPKIFEKYLIKEYDYKLETDYADHIDEEVEALRVIMTLLYAIRKYGPHRPKKSLNLFLWSQKPSFGKTRLLNFLNDNCSAYRLPDDQYYIDYSNNKYHVLVSDESEAFIKTKDYAHLKMSLEGQPTEFNMKNRTKVMKEDNPMMVLAANHDFNYLMGIFFGKVYQREVFDSRIKQIELKSRATLHFLMSKCMISIKDREEAINKWKPATKDEEGAKFYPSQEFKDIVGVNPTKLGHKPSKGRAYGKECRGYWVLQEKKQVKTDKFA